MEDLHALPKVRDSWSYLYVEHCRVDRGDKAIVLHDARGRVPVPCATLAVLMLGPGTTITHAAIRVLAESGCLTVWCGEEGVRFYAQGMGETRSSGNLLHQARMWADPARRLEVVIRLYRARFSEPLDPSLTLKQIRGREGIRVREAYAAASREYGVKWDGRSYVRGAFYDTDPVNRALSTANACLYGVCHAAIVSAGYSPALGFIHTGKMLSFVYDVADLYKTEVCVPVAFREAAAGPAGLETRVRKGCRDLFADTRLLARIIPDIQRVLGAPGEEEMGATAEADYDAAEDAAAPGALWAPEGETLGGVNFGDIEGASDGSDDS